MSVELKIKAKSLAEEASIIRKEEKREKEKGNTERVQSLHHHRTQRVRRAARSTHLARALLSGKTYAQVEQSTRQPLPAGTVKEVERMVSTYAPEVKLNDVRRWFLAEWVRQRPITATAAAE